MLLRPGHNFFGPVSLDFLDFSGSDLDGQNVPFIQYIFQYVVNKERHSSVQHI